MSVRRRFTIGVAWMFAGNWVELGCNFAFFVVLAHLLAPEALGTAMMSMAFITFGEALVRETLSESLIRRQELDSAFIDALFWSLGGLAVALAAILALSAPFIAAHIYHEAKVTDLLRVASLSIVFIGFSGIPVSLMRRELEFRVLAVRATIGVMAGGAVGIALAVMGYGPWAIIGQRVVHVLVTNLLAWMARPWRPGLRATAAHFREVWSFGGKMLGFRTTELISVQTPSVIIGSVLGAAALGHFTIAWRAVETMSVVLTTPIRYVAQPAFAKLQSEPEHVGGLLADATQTSALIGFSCFMGLAAIADPALPLIFGAHWQPAIPVLSILCGVGLFFSIERVQQAFCLALGAPGRLMFASTLEAMLGIVMILFAAQFGLLPVAAAFTARYLLLWPLRFYIVKTVAHIRMTPYLIGIAVPLALSVIMYGGVMAWRHVSAAWLPAIPSMITAILVGVILFGAGLQLFLPQKVRQLVDLVKNWRAALTETA